MDTTHANQLDRSILLKWANPHAVHMLLMHSLIKEVSFSWLAFQGASHVTIGLKVCAIHWCSIQGTSGGKMVSKLDKQTFISEFESNWVLHSYCLVPHLNKKLSKLLHLKESEICNSKTFKVPGRISKSFFLSRKCVKSYNFTFKKPSFFVQLTGKLFQYPGKVI